MNTNTQDDAAGPTQEPTTLSPHLVLFLDFLGISNAAMSWDDERIVRFIPILKSLARSQSPFSIDGHAQEDGSYKLIVSAEISAFSDNVVASYPVLVDDSELTVADQLTVFLELASRLVSSIAFQAMSMSLLIRGGISYGRLHHSDGVVFGEAMVDAYQLESRVANYPRVVVSPRVYTLKSERDVLTSKRNSLLQDTDGIWHLNYFSELLYAVAGDVRAEVFERAKAHIASVASDFESAGKLNEFAKWSWFSSHFVRHAGPRS